MRKFPTFLKVLPEFYGLSFSDLGTIMMVLYLGLIMNLNPLVTLIFCGIGVLVFKIVRKNCDLRGWILPKRQTLLMKEAERGEK